MMIRKIMQEVRKVVITTVKGETDKTKITKEITSRKQQGVKSESSGNITSTAATPAVTRQRGRPRAVSAEDTTKVQSKEDEQKGR